jgi:hypothetical protein
MTIKLHSFTVCCQRYIQLETQPHHISGILKKVNQFIKTYNCDFADVASVHYQCHENGTITFYQGQKNELGLPGIWTYMLYPCSSGQEKVFSDESLDTSVEPLKQIITGNKLIQTTVEISSYLKYQYYDSEYLDVRLPYGWNYDGAIEISRLLLEEFTVFQTSSIFSVGAGKSYMEFILDKFTQVASEIVENRGSLQDFEIAQYGILRQITTDEVANLIIQHNDYRIWQRLLPSKSKAVEHAFNSALSLLAKI